MKGIFLFLILNTFIACHRQTELQKLCKRIRQSPQVAFPSGKDVKWNLIRNFEQIKDPALPDSIKNIFTTIDTSVRGYSVYQFSILGLLIKPDSRKSLKVLAEIFNENHITDPSCSQVISNLFLDKSLWGDLLISYLTKENSVDYGKVLKNVEVMFPSLPGCLANSPFLIVQFLI